MLWETSEKTYAEVDLAINPANITWARVWEDVRRLEEMVKTEKMGQDELCDRVFQKMLSENHPKAMPRAWTMTVSFETPYQHDDEVDEDEKKNESGAGHNADEGTGTQESGAREGRNLVPLPTLLGPHGPKS